MNNDLLHRRFLGPAGWLYQTNRPETVTLDEETRRVFEEVAAVEGMTVAEVINRACQSLARRYKKIVLPKERAIAT